MTWDHYLMAVAESVAAKSKDTTKVGAVIVSDKNAILCTGFNGLPMGVKEFPSRLERPTKYLFTSHAEMNALAFAARHGVATEGKTIYVTHQPCSMCARLIIQSGIRQVIYGKGTTSMPREEFDVAHTMFCESGVEVREHG